MSNQKKIDCVLLSCFSRKYLLPMNALVEIISMKKEVSFLGRLDDLNVKIHRITWNELEIPLISINDSPFQIKGTKFEKIMIMRAFFSENYKLPHFFGLYINEDICKKTLFPETIKWVNEDQKIVQIIEQERVLDAMIFDLFSFSVKIEKFLS